MQAAHHIERPVGADLAICAFEQMDATKTLLIICSPGTISAAMTAAMRSEFPWLLVELAHDIEAAAREYEHPVQLILADASFGTRLHANWDKLSALHKEATTALIWCDKVGGSPQCRWVPYFPWVQGIVPFNVNLDVFLSAIRILLMGGHYFPTSSHRAHEAETKTVSHEIVAPDGLPEDGNGQMRGIEKLTRRENEILARMAMGNQNKIIAATLGLSEHTVKIHIHNIITKLGVHNRTEVVARYFEYRRKDVHDHAGDPQMSNAKKSDGRDEI